MPRDPVVEGGRGKAGFRQRRRVAEKDHLLDRWHLRQQLFDKFGGRGIGDQKPVAGMVRDIGDLFEEQPRVEGVEHRAHPRRAIPGGEVPRAVPRHRRDAVAGLDPFGGERIRHALRVGMNVGIGRAGDAPLGIARHDLARAVPVRRMVDDPVDRQRHILHQPVHAALSLVAE